MNEDNINIKIFLIDKLAYIQNIIINTIMSIKLANYSLFSENDKNLSITILNDLYNKANDIDDQLNKKSNDNHNQLLEELQKIIDKLSMIICGFGTSNIEDLLFVSFGIEYKNLSFEDEILNDKYYLIKKFIRPIGYKMHVWKNKSTKSNLTKCYCNNKNEENIREIENYNTIECLNYDDDIENPIQKIERYQNYIKCIIHNDKLKKTMIINGIIQDFPIDCLQRNKYISYRFQEINDEISNKYDEDDKSIFQNIINSLCLKELLIYGKNDILKRHISILYDVEYVKNNLIDNIVKKFLDSDIIFKRSMLLNLLSYHDESEIQYTCYILYDLINTSILKDDETEGSLIHNSLPQFIKTKFKNIVKLHIKSYQETNKIYETNKLSLEQKIHMLKVDDNIKEKAMNKLNDIKGKPDEITMKTKQYLEGLIKIPFETYYEEPIIKLMQTNNGNFVNFINNNSFLLENTDIPIKKKYTNSEISTFTSNIEYKLFENCNKYITENIRNFTHKDLLYLMNKIINLLKTKKINISTIKCKNKKNIMDFICKCINKKDIHYLLYTCNEINIIQNKNPMKINEELKEIKFNINNIREEIQSIESILDESIHGHQNAKKQLIKIVAQWMNGKKEGYCFGFEGSPGIGKTSLANKGLAKCLKNTNNSNRPFSFIALGGSSNGSFLEGHSYTYMNSTWGKIVDILMDSKCMNPIIYIDELDKVSKTEQGKEIIGILTHLIDPTQNTHFQDKYFTGINIDVSKILFIFSYNDAEQIDKILLDRIHRIKFENLSLEEKVVIVNKFIIPEINDKMGFENVLTIKKDCIKYIIESYTNEPGVRKLKEILFDLYGEINLQMLKEPTSNMSTYPHEITISDLETRYLCKYTKINKKIIHDNAQVGIINGLWANTLGQGGITQIQTLLYPSSSFLELQLTGLQGDVMKESMNVSKTLAWSLTEDNIKETWLTYFSKTKCQGLHIHCPEGGISKDGPSAGAAITTAIYSLFNKKTIKNDIAITGEITLNGDITEIGGLDIKINSGIKAGIKTILYPKNNHRDYVLWESKYGINNNILFVEVANIKDVFEHVFI